MIGDAVKIGTCLALLLTFATTTVAVVDGPEPGEGEMAIMSHSTTASGSSSASRSTSMDRHVTDIDLDFVFDGDEGQMPAECQEDIREARSESEGKMCTEQVANLQCPHESDTVYMAPNGCVISSLQDKGWSQVPINQSAQADEEKANQVTLSGYIAFRTGGYTVQTSSSTEGNTALFVVNITSPGPNTTVTQAITREQINLTQKGEEFDSARATVYIDGEEMYGRSETRSSERVDERPSSPPDDRSSAGLRERVKMLEQRVVALESRLTALQNALDGAGIDVEEAPSENGSTSREDDSRPENRGTSRSPVEGIINAISGIFG